MAGTPSLEEVIRSAVDAGLARVNVSMPGRIESYDKATQRADITPMLQRPVYTAEGASRPEPLPVIPAVRVIHPGGTDWAIHCPLRAGDTVEIIFQQWDPTTWQRTGEVSTPLDRRTFSVAHAVAIPGYRKDSAPISDTEDEAITFHSNGLVAKLTASALEVGGNSEAAAKASAVDQRLNDLAAALNAWIPVANDGGAALKAALATWLGGTSNTASSKIKMGG